MATVDRVLPWRRQAAAPADEVAPLVAAYRARHPKASTSHDHPGLRGRGHGARRADPQVGRALHPPPARGGPDRRRARARRRSRWPPPCCTTRSRTPGSRSTTSQREFGAEVAGDRRRRHQARPDPVRLEGGAAGRHDAQDARGDGQGPAGPDHQAGRPAAQHAHDRGDARRASRSAPRRRRSTSTRRWPTASACRT